MKKNLIFLNFNTLLYIESKKNGQKRMKMYKNGRKHKKVKKT